MLEIKNPKNIELPLENCKICGTPTSPLDMAFVPPCSKICNKCYSVFYEKEASRIAYKNAEKEAKENGYIRVKLDLPKLLELKDSEKSMNRYNAQILNDKGEYHLQFETDSRDNFNAMEKLAQKFIDNKPRTNFDRVTENAEALAKYISSLARKCTFRDCSKEECAKFECEHCIKEWLQKECEE